MVMCAALLFRAEVHERVARYLSFSTLGCATGQSASHMFESPRVRRLLATSKGSRRWCCAAFLAVSGLLGGSQGYLKPEQA